MDESPVPLPNSFPVTLLIALICLIIMSAFFSGIETAYSCSNKIKLRALASNGNKRAKSVLLLAEEKFDNLITAVLIGNNIVNLTASTLAVLFFQKILADGVNYSVVSTVVITLAVLIFGEVTPKFIAKVYPEKIAIAFYPIVIFFYYVFRLISFVFSGWKWLLSKIFKLKPDNVVTEDEILTVVEEAEEDGTLKKEETKLIRSVIEFDDLEVGDILVPRVNIVAVEVSDNMEDIKKIFEREGYSRLPVYKDSIDTIIGTIHEKDFFTSYLSKKSNINDILQNAFYTTEHAKISVLLRQLQKMKVHIAIVLDEYGGTLGLLTLEDILEELVGEIWDEHDEEIDFFKRVNDNISLVDGNAPLDEVFEFIGQAGEDEKFDANTLSGWVIEKLGEIPRAGKKFAYENFEFEVLKSTVKRVLQVKMTRLHQDTEE